MQICVVKANLIANISAEKGKNMFSHADFAIRTTHKCCVAAKNFKASCLYHHNSSTQLRFRLDRFCKDETYLTAQPSIEF